MLRILFDVCVNVCEREHSGHRYHQWCVCVCPVSLRLAGPELPLLAVAGQELVLPCSFPPSDDTQQLSVVWYRINGDTQTHIHMHSNGTDHNEDQSHDYRGRTSLFLGEISTGNVSLKLSGARLSDVGRYQLLTQEMGTMATLIWRSRSKVRG